MEHPDVAFVTFTGSQAVGLHIVERAAVAQPGQRQVKRVVAEMGGKNPVVVDADADLDLAVPAITAQRVHVRGSEVLGGVTRHRIGAGLRRARRTARRRRRGGAGRDGPELRTVCGPLIDDEADERVGRYQALAHQEGTVVLERTDVPTGGWFRAPMVVVVDDPHVAGGDRRDLRPDPHGPAR